MSRFPLLGLLTLFLASTASLRAAEPEATTGSAMLVLDASGSMWGQLQGKPKIELAREAVGSMLATWPRTEALGLIAYGHRRKGDCADIEILQVPASLDTGAFRTQVNGLQPKGMTPISASVKLAAEQLRFTEQKATVILVSDGEETCDADPCALGTELEKLGVDFTAHVIGFDLPEGKARAQLQCLAKNTGGRYIEARNAADLGKALKTVATAPPEPPATIVPASGCTLFDETNFRGNTRQVAPGETNGWYGDSEGRFKSIASMRCSKDCRIAFWDSADFVGKRIELGGEQPTVTAGLDGEPAGYAVACGEAPVFSGCTLYQGKDHSGKQWYKPRDSFSRALQDEPESRFESAICSRDCSPSATAGSLGEFGMTCAEPAP